MVATFQPPAAPMFVQLGRDLWRSIGSRFDIYDTFAGYFVAVDADTARTYRSPEFALCAIWCEIQELEPVVGEDGR